MARKHTPEEPTAEAINPAATATAEPAAEEIAEEKPHFVARVDRERQTKPVPDPFGIASDNLAGVRLFESRRDRVMAIEFDEKPSLAVLDTLKDAGFRWNASHRVWTHPLHAESALTTRIEAYRVYEEMRGMIRREKGVESTPEIPF